MTWAVSQKSATGHRPPATGNRLRENVRMEALIEPGKAGRTVFAVVAAIAVALAAGYAIVVPPGEAPDEPAHIGYVRHLVATGTLPAAPERFDHFNYEFHQPPFDYLVSAAAVRLVIGDLDVELEPVDSLDFETAGSRAFEAISGARELRILRIVRLAWLLLTLGGIWSLLSTLGLDRWWHALFASIWILNPQVLFISAVITNDASVTAFATWTVAFLARAVVNGRMPDSIAAGVAFALAIFSKGSGLFLLAPIGAVVLVLVRGRRVGSSVAIVGTASLGLAAWGSLNLARFGSFMPPVPGGGGGEVVELITAPGWTASIFASFWAKFGWLNTPMEPLFYGWFALVSLASLAGGLVLYRRDRQRSLLLMAALGGNALLVLAFMVRVDWQPQGRYLFPSIGVLVCWGVALAEMIPERWRRVAAAGSMLIAVSIALAGLLTIRAAFG